MLVPWLAILASPALVRVAAGFEPARRAALVRLQTPANLEADGVGGASSPRRSFLLGADQPGEERL
jgi:hypothetical protein